MQKQQYKETNYSAYAFQNIFGQAPPLKAAKTK